MDKHMPGADKSDFSYIYGYSVARTMVQVLKQCGDDLTRENIMNRPPALKDFEPGLLLAGNCGQYQPDGLRADRAIAVDEVRRPDLATLR